MADFIADENVSKSVIAALRRKGFSVLSVKEEGLSGAKDKQILKLAKKTKVIIITHDQDFGFLVHNPRNSHPGIILLRLHVPRPKNVIETLLPFLEKTKTAKLKGRFTVIREGVIRII